MNQKTRGRVSLLTLAVVADIVWACLCSTFGGTIFHLLAGLFKADAEFTKVGTIVGGVIGFFAGLISGAAMLFVCGMLILLIGVIFGKKKS